MRLRTLLKNEQRMRERGGTTEEVVVAGKTKLLIHFSNHPGVCRIDEVERGGCGSVIDSPFIVESKLIGSLCEMRVKSIRNYYTGTCRLQQAGQIYKILSSVAYASARVYSFKSPRNNFSRDLPYTLTSGLDKK